MAVGITILNSTVSLTGELTFSNARELWNLGMQLFINKNYRTSTVAHVKFNTPVNAQLDWVDLTHVTKVDSSGLAVMVEWQRLAGGKLAFVAIPLELELIAQVAGVDSLFKPQM